MPFEMFSALPPGLQQLIQGKRAPRELPVLRRPLCNPRVPEMALEPSIPICNPFPGGNNGGREA